jgi:hypothetical protein
LTFRKIKRYSEGGEPNWAITYKIIIDFEFATDIIYNTWWKMAPPVAVEKNGSSGKAKPVARSLKRKRAMEDYEKLQKDVQALVSERLRWGRVIANFLKGHKRSRYQELCRSTAIKSHS